MPTIWSAISGHGYGHAAQVIPVLNQLAKHVPNLKSILRTTVPASFFQDRLNIPWDLQPVEQDIGCIQKGPLQIDVPATWERHIKLHREWEQRVMIESTAMKAACPQVILADTPYLAVSAGCEAGIPAVVIANFTWNEILEPFAEPGDPRHGAILADISRSYGQADLALRAEPGLAMPSFSKVLDIGPLAEPAVSCREELRRHLGLSTSDRLVLVAFGGIPLLSLPWLKMSAMQGFHFIVDDVPGKFVPRIHSKASLPFSFKTLLASVDTVMTKPGYGTIVEAVNLGLSVVYVRRFNFADEPPLITYLQRYGRGYELSLDDFLSGRWEYALDAINDQTSPLVPTPSGAADAANHLRRYF